MAGMHEGAIQKATTGGLQLLVDRINEAWLQLSG